MDWYYADSGRQVGPVPAAQFDQLVSSGKVTPDTLVWHDGLANWQPYRALRPAAPPVMTGPSATCVECGYHFPTGEMISYGEAWVCARCKPVFFQRIREGAPLAAGAANVWRSGDAVVVATGIALPDRCSKCNGAVTGSPINRTLYWHQPWVYLILLSSLLVCFIGLLVYIIVSMVVRKRATLAIPICEEHRSKRWMIIAVSWLLVIGGTAGVAVGAMNGIDWLTVLGGIGVAVGVIYGVWKGTLVSAKKIDGEYVWVNGFCKEYRELLPDFPEYR